MKTPLLRLLTASIFVCSLLSASLSLAQTYNLITSGEMESQGWTGVPGNTNLTTSFEAGSGLGSTTSLKTVVSAMGGASYYILRGEEAFPLTQSKKITVSFWAKGSVDDMRLQPWIQESDGNQWMNFGDAYLSTNWKQYQFTMTLTTQTSNNYNVKFRGYHTGTMYIDNVQIGPVDYEDVEQSGIYEVTLSQNGMTWPVNVFRNSCPQFQLGYQDMEAKDENPLELFSGRTINWTKFSFENPITVHVKVINTTKVPVAGQSVKILPSRHGVTATTSGNVVNFTITEPGQYSVEIGDEGYKNGLMIFADPTETDIPAKSDPDYLVLYQADASDLSSIPGSYNGIYFERGVHNIGVFTIPVHIKNIYFEDGSWVYGALKMDGNSNVRIYGRGVLSSYKMNYRQAHCVEAINGSNNITIEGLVVADPKYFAIRLIGTDNVVSYAKVIGGWVYNCDGIAAFEGSSVSKSFIWANDDAIKVYRDSITWSDIVVWQLNNGGVIQMSWGGAIGGSTAKVVKISRLDVLRAEWNVDRFNVGLLNCVGNRYHQDGRYNLLENWLIEDVVTETEIPLIWNISPDDYTHCHIHGLNMRNWNVKMKMSLGFQNRIIGTDPNDFFSGFVFDNVVFKGDLLTNINYITNGEMDKGGWTAVPKSTDQIISLANGYGTGDGEGLRSVVTNMGGGSDYVIKGNETFAMYNNEEITISFWAKATAAGKRLVPWIQETVNNAWMNLGDLNLTTNYQRYSFTTNMTLGSSDFFQVKFRGYETAWIYIDKVQIGPPDWRTLIEPQIQYLNTPVFLPNDSGSRTSNITHVTGMTEVENPIIFPNPVKDAMHLTGYEEDTNYKIFSFAGQMETSGTGSRIDVSHLPAGVYLLSIEGLKWIRFIKQ
ncbi:MAG: T9SS type A sorting domain-containing protein [Cyclobacteriaceae bacterium]